MNSDAGDRHALSDGQGRVPKTAIGYLPAHLVLWGATAVALAADLYSKHWAFRVLDSHELRTVVPGVLAFRRSLNSGALFGMGAGRGPVFILASIVALGFVVYLFWHSEARQRGLHLALGLILAGALGNLYDRVFMVADILTLATPPGYAIGLKVPGPDPDSVYLGSFPEGSTPRRYSVGAIVAQGQVGVVRDFIRLEPTLFGRQLWPWVFNMADTWLVAGVGILMIDFFRTARRGRGNRPGRIPRESSPGA
ncbi:MAG: signal peptidase II [Planctomycetes bacterium]|nr:signal peptidase II [Planctomycetota bacterium]